MADAPRLAGDLGHRGVGRADQLAAVAGGDHAAKLARAAARALPEAGPGARRPGGPGRSPDRPRGRPATLRRAASSRTIFNVRDRHRCLQKSSPLPLLDGFDQGLQARPQRRLQGVGNGRDLDFHAPARRIAGGRLGRSGRPPGRSGWRRESARSTTASAPNRRTSAADPPGAVGRRADHRIGQRHPRQGFHRRQVLGDRVQGMAEEVLGAADPAAGVFQQVHHPQVGHRIDPEHPHRRLVEHALAGPDPASAPRPAGLPAPPPLSAWSEQKWMASISAMSISSAGSGQGEAV